MEGHNTENIVVGFVKEFFLSKEYKNLLMFKVEEEHSNENLLITNNKDIIEFL